MDTMPTEGEDEEMHDATNELRAAVGLEEFVGAEDQSDD